MNSRPLTSYRVIKYFGGEISVTDLLSPQSHSSGRVLFKWPRTSRRFLILSWSASIWNLMTKWVTWKRCAWVFWCQVYSMSFVHSPPGPHSSYGLSRLWRTDRFLFHSGHCHSSRWNTWKGCKKKKTPIIHRTLTNTVFIFLENLPSYLWVTFTEFGYPTALVSSASISSEPSSEPKSNSGSSGL